MKRSKIALVTAFALVAAAATVAVAAPRKADAPKPATPEQLAEAKGLVQTLGLACTVTDARFAGTGETKTDQGKEKISIYEVACQEKLGWIVAGREKSAPTAYNCVMAATSSAQAKAEGKQFGEVCQLPANQDHKAAVQAQVQRVGLACTVSEHAWLGQLQTGDRYEVACAEGPGYVVDVPSTATGPGRAIGCPQAGAAGLACQLTTKEEQTAVIASVAAKSGRACTVSDARYVATDQAGNVYYEVGCGAGQAGYMVETDPKGGYKRALDCVQAQGIAGGCKLTDAATAAAAEGQQIVSRVKSAGVNCALTGHRRVGVENTTNRDVVELACSDRPTGLMAFIPATGAAQAIDCLTAETRKLKCELTSRTALQGVLTSAMTAGGKTCDVVNYRVIGQSMTEGEVLEVACGGGQKKGYIVDMPKDRSKPRKALSCSTAAQNPDDKCVLPENV